MKRFASLLAFGLLAGCATAPVLTPVGFEDPKLKAVRSILQQGQPTDAIFKTGKPFAFVLLDDNDSGRNKKICDAYQGLTTPDLANLNPNNKVVPTYWPVKLSGLSQDQQNNLPCSTMLANYDHQRAMQIANIFDLPSASSAYIMAVDGAGKTFYINIDNGSKKQLKQVMWAWYKTAALNGGQDGIELKEWWRSAAEDLCGKDFVVEAAKAFLPGWAGFAVGIVLDKGKCKLETPNRAPVPPSTVTA